MAHHLADQEINQDVSAELAEYEATFDEIEAATESMEVHRAQFQKMLNKPAQIAERAHVLFAETRFEPFRYASTDVRRACEALAYNTPPIFDSPDYTQFIGLATAYLTDKKSRLHLGEELLKMVPDYVTAKRFMDAWLIQFCAHQLAESIEANPFLVEMFKYGLAELSTPASPKQ